ncbi:DUF3283 family protein [Vibrio parahaemolyticus]|nr:DUF3283 family protein [Vibrio parahaemolyticus]
MNLKSYNLASLPGAERERIELDKSASFLVWKLNAGKVTALDIEAAISNVETEELREYFQSRLRHYGAR